MAADEFDWLVLSTVLVRGAHRVSSILNIHGNIEASV